MKWGLAVGTLVLFALGLGIPLYLTSGASFYAGQKNLKARYDSWRGSSHKNVSCAACHLKPGAGRAISYRLRTIREFYGGLVSDSGRKAVLGKASSQACASCHEGRTLRATDSRVPLIPHQIHDARVGEQKDCLQCHKWLAHDEKFQARHKSLPLTGVCFKYGCHGEVRPARKVQECQSCHHQESVSSADWRKQRHPDVVNASGASRCFDYCHKPEWCRSCHLTGEKTPMEGVTAISVQASSTLISRHASKGWLDFHGREALANSKKCLACHANFQLCKTCHSIRPTSHGRKETWLARHKKPAKESDRGCLTCHQKRVCDRCHELFKEVGR